MAKSSFTITSLILLTTALAAMSAGFVWWNRPPDPEYWKSGLVNAKSINTAEVRRHLENGSTEWQPMPISDAYKLVAIAERCPIFFTNCRDPSPIFPPPTSTVKISAANRTIEIEILGSGTSMTALNYATLIADRHRNEIIELVDPDSELYDRQK